MKQSTKKFTWDVTNRKIRRKSRHHSATIVWSCLISKCHTVWSRWSGGGYKITLKSEGFPDSDISSWGDRAGLAGTENFQRLACLSTAPFLGEVERPTGIWTIQKWGVLAQKRLCATGGVGGFTSRPTHSLGRFLTRMQICLGHLHLLQNSR